MGLACPLETEIIFKEKVDNGHGDFKEKVILARQPYIRASDLEEHGMTRGCPKCDHFVKYQTWGSRPFSNICRTRITAELAKTQAGRIRISAASERLDKTVEELGQRFRTDVPQGEKPDVMVQHQSEQVIPQFLPIPQSTDRLTDVVRDVSREVPPPADEPGGGETHEFKESFEAPEARVSAEPGMDIDLVEEKDDVDLKRMMATLRRDEKAEIEETNREILAVLKSLGTDTAKYRRERSRSIRVVVSE